MRRNEGCISAAKAALILPLPPAKAKPFQSRQGDAILICLGVPGENQQEFHDED
jgi:hypothetical protein